MANDALILFIIMLGCVLITALICWLVWGRARNAIEIELTTVRQATEHELAHLSERCEQLEGNAAHDRDALARQEEEKQTVTQRCGELGRELKDVTGQLADANSQLVNLKLQLAQGNGDATPGQQKGDEVLECELREMQSELADMIIDRDDWKGRYESLEAEYQQHGHGANSEELGQLREQLAIAQSRLVELERESALQVRDAATDATDADPEQVDEHTDLPANSPANSPAEVAGDLPAEPQGDAGASAPIDEVDDVRSETLARIAERAGLLDLKRLGHSNEQRDDLTLIKGIGPFVERKLNALGLCTYAQISRFTAQDEEVVNEAIEFFPGRIRRDDWIGQAQKLLDEKK